MSTPTHDEHGLPVGYPLRPEWEVTPGYVRDRLAAARDGSEIGGKKRAFLLIDCRRDDEVSLCRIDGSTWVPMHEIEARLDELELDLDEADLSRCGDAMASTPRGHEVVVYCHHGARSMRVAATLRGHGFTNVKSMAGGIEAWSIGIDAGVPRY